MARRALEVGNDLAQGWVGHVVRRPRVGVLVLAFAVVFALPLPAMGELAEWQQDDGGFGEGPTDLSATEDGLIVYSFISEYLFGGELPVPGDVLVLDSASGESVKTLPVTSGSSIDVSGDRILIARQDEFEPPRLEVWDWNKGLLAERDWPDVWPDSYSITDVAILGSKAVAIVSSVGFSSIELFDLEDLASLGTLDTAAELSRYTSLAVTGDSILVNVENRRLDSRGSERFESTTVHVYRDMAQVGAITLTRDGVPIRGSMVEPARDGGMYVLSDRDFADVTGPPVVTLHDSSGAFVEELWRSSAGYLAVGIDTDGCLGLVGMAATGDVSSVQGFKYVPDLRDRDCFVDAHNSCSKKRSTGWPRLASQKVVILPTTPDSVPTPPQPELR